MATEDWNENAERFIMRTTSMARRLIVCGVYAVAMAYVESTVVVYLRQLIDGGTQLFPLRPLPAHLFRAELFREFATILMLGCVAVLQSRRPRVILAFFLYCFGIWDIFYYVWLKVLIGWPAGPLTWDVLFLIPAPWFGPVLSPSIVSLLFIGASLAIVRFETLGRPLRFTQFDRSMGVVGAIVIVASYLRELPLVARTGYPHGYPWWLFAIGSGVWVATVVRRIVITNGEFRRSGASDRQ